MKWTVLFAAVANIGLLIVNFYNLHELEALRKQPLESTQHSFMYNKPQWLSVDILDKDTVFTTLSPMDIIVHFVDPAALSSICPLQAIACAMPTKRPCEIYLPAWQRLAFMPSLQLVFHDYSGYASDSWGSNMFEHEVLHCQYPNWHQPWTQKHPVTNLLNR